MSHLFPRCASGDFEGSIMRTAGERRIHDRMLAANAAAFLIGICFIVWPRESSLMLARVSGVILLAGALIETVMFFLSLKNRGNALLSLITAVILGAAGIWCIGKPDVIMGFFNVVFGIGIILVGLANIYQSLFVIRPVSAGRRISAAASVIAVAVGVFIILNPFSFTTGLMMWIGIGLVIEALFGIINIARRA